MSEAGSVRRVFLVDDEKEIRDAWSETLSLDGFVVKKFGEASRVLSLIDRNWPGAIVTDLKMTGMDGIDLLDAVRRVDVDIPVLIVTGHGDIPMAISAVRKGAYDFIEKPANPDILLNAVARAVEKRELVLENRRLSANAEMYRDLESRLIGRDPAMYRLRDQVRAFAAADVNVVIYGETGSGKEVVARALHECGVRVGRPFVALNCGALPETLISSELFGHEPGAFTGAQKRRIGKLEQANGGTLFLDEIESMPLYLQTQLLRALQEKEIERLGSSKCIPLDLRVVAAAKVDLDNASQQGTFRSDLYYRIAVASLNIPPLRARRDDIPLIFMHYVAEIGRRHGIPIPNVPETYLAGLTTGPWRGNVRELINAAERYALGIEPGSDDARTRISDEQTLAGKIDAFERRTLIEALRLHSGRISETARHLGVPRKKLYLRMQRHELTRDEFLSED